MALEGVIQDFCHVQMLIERATSDYANVQCHDFSGLLSRLRSVVADRCKHDLVTKAAS